MHVCIIPTQAAQGSEFQLMALKNTRIGSWSEAQEEKRQELKDKLYEFKRHPERRVKFLTELQQKRYG